MAGKPRKPIEERIAYIQEQIANSESRLISLKSQLTELLQEQEEIKAVGVSGLLRSLVYPSMISKRSLGYPVSWWTPQKNVQNLNQLNEDENQTTIRIK